MIQHQAARKRSKGRGQRIKAQASQSQPGDSRSTSFLLLLAFGLSLLAFALGGCAGGRSYKEHYYILEAIRPGEPSAARSDATLEVHRFSVDAAFAGKGLVYRLDEMQYETDYYRQLLIAPGTMITEKTRRWLADAGLFGQVLPVGSRIAPTHTLEGNVTALYGDFADESNAAAVIEIRFFLLANTEGQEHVAFAQTYRAATAVRDRTAEVFVEALNQSLVGILTRLEADLRKALAE